MARAQTESKEYLDDKDQTDQAGLQSLYAKTEKDRVANTDRYTAPIQASRASGGRAVPADVVCYGCRTKRADMVAQAKKKPHFQSFHLAGSLVWLCGDCIYRKRLPCPNKECQSIRDGPLAQNYPDRPCFTCQPRLICSHCDPPCYIPLAHETEDMYDLDARDVCCEDCEQRRDDNARRGRQVREHDAATNGDGDESTGAHPSKGIEKEYKSNAGTGSDAGMESEPKAISAPKDLSIGEKDRLQDLSIAEKDRRQDRQRRKRKPIVLADDECGEQDEQKQQKDKRRRLQLSSVCQRERQEVLDELRELEKDSAHLPPFRNTRPRRRCRKQ